MDIFYGFAFGWFSTLSGVVMGGYLVFRAVKSQGEKLFPVNQMLDETAFNLPDHSTDEEIDAGRGIVEELAKNHSDRVESAIGKKHFEFLNQFKKVT